MRTVFGIGALGFLVGTVMASGSARGAQAILSGSTATADTTIYLNAATDNAGGSTILFAGRNNQPSNRRALISFDLASIPSGATVTGVSLQMTISNLPPSGSVTSQSLYKVSSSWVEGTGAGTGSGGTSVPGAATWNSRQDGSLAWTTAGGDFAVSPSATASAPTSFTNVTWSGGGLVADVSAWLAAPATNFGWILIGDESTAQSIRGYNSSEAVSNAPTLTVDYTASAVGDWTAY
ncbi:hypothetical protein BH09SUM1_BH09SUM1_10210 [soil metagenome]